MKLVRVALFSLGFAFVLSFSACSAKIDSSIAADNSALLEVNIQFNPILQAYLKDLSGDKASQFDEKSIRSRLSEQKGLKVSHLEASLEKGIQIGARIADIRQLLASESSEIQDLIAIKNIGSKKRLVLTLNRKIVNSFLTMASSNKEISYLLPQDKTLTAKKYQEQLSWALEEYGDKSKFPDMFKNATIKMQLSLPGAVQSLKGFTMVDQKTGVVALEISLIDLLTLPGNISFEATY